MFELSEFTQNVVDVAADWAGLSNPAINKLGLDMLQFGVDFEHYESYREYRKRI